MFVPDGPMILIIDVLQGESMLEPLEGVSRAGSRGRVLNFYDDTEQGGKEPSCQVTMAVSIQYIKRDRTIGLSINGDTP